MELKHLKTFKAVAETLSFTQAAKQLHYVQSSVSSQIQTLEHDLGVTLFDRMGRGIRLTDAGKRLLRYARKIEDIADEITAEMRGVAEARGSLTIRVPESICTHHLPRIIADFTSKHPKVDLDFRTCTQQGLAEDLRKGIVDLAFLYADSVQGADMESSLLRTERLVLVAGERHPLAKRKRVSVRDLADYPLLLSKTDCSYRKVLETMLIAEGIDPVPLMEFTSAEAIRQCVSRGTGISIFPESTANRMVPDMPLAVLHWDAAPVETGLLMVRHKDKWCSPLLTSFMDAVSTNLG